MKKHLFSLWCALVLCAPPLCAQYLAGRVVDKTKEPVSYATVYISELQQGVVTNAAGVFELSAPEGSYNLVVTCVGYKTARISWATVSKIGSELKTISLEDAEYQIPAVYVTAKKEDPAYTIMRKAIGMAPYYRNLVQSYTAEVYLKGNLEITKLKGAAALALGREKRNIIKNLSGIHESVSEIVYTAPDKYVQTVKAEKTAANVDLKKLGVKEEDVQLGLANFNIYSSRPNMPLAPNAFQNYTFKYLGDSEVDGVWVAKIRVTPRRNANDLLTGYLYIVREKWSVQELDLSQSNAYTKSRVQQTYRFVLEEVLLPVTYNASGSFDGFGMGFNAHFSGSIKYSNVLQNQRMAQENREKSATLQVQELIDKAELKPKDMRTLRKIQEQTVTAVREEERKERGEKPSLEVVNNYRIIKDSVRVQSDSAYWALIRPIPLERTELKIFGAADSIKMAPDTPEEKRRKWMEVATGIIGGHTFKIDSLWRISYSGLMNSLETGYNVVDGWVYGQAFRVRKETKNSGYIQLRGRASWAFCREAFMWNVLAEQNYWSSRRAYWRLEVSSQTRDFAGDQGVGKVNDWSTLFFRINPTRFYDARGIDFAHRIDLANGLVWSVGLKWEERHPLSNNSDYSWFYQHTRSFSPNTPDENRYVYHNPILIDPNRAAIIRLGLSYTPQHYYRMYKGQKMMLRSKYPTFSAEWVKGVPKVWGSQSDFDFVRIQIEQRRNFGYHNTFEYQVDAGKFLYTGQLYFADFHHIYANQSGVSLDKNLRSFQLLPTYALSTPEWYLQAHVRYQTPYLALKHLPIFKSPLIQEGIHFSYLFQPTLRHYTEFGYSLNNLFMMVDVGLFVGFEQTKYRSWGFRLSVPLERLTGAMRL